MQSYDNNINLLLKSQPQCHLNEIFWSKIIMGMGSKQVIKSQKVLLLII